MATSTTKTNKPINPRGNDQSPLAFNRAKLYSGKALDFDGTNDYVEVADDSSLDFTTAMSAFCYARVDSVSQSNNTFFAKYDYGNNNRSWILLQTNDVFRVIISKNGQTSGTNIKDYQFSTFENTSDYYFIGFTFESNVLKLYVNGQEVEPNKVSDNEVNAIHSGTAKASVGCNFSSGTPQAFLNGKVANARAFNVALTAAQVSDLYNNPEKIVPTGVEDTALKLWLPMMEGAGTTAYNGAPDALGSELITNGNFETNSDWSLGSGSTISGGSLNIVSAPYNANTKQTISLTSGKTYIVNINATATGSSTDNTFQLGFGDSAGNPSNLTQHEFTPGTSIKSLFITASATDATIVFRSRDAGTSNLSVHSVSAKEITGVGTISGATWVQGVGAPVAQTAVIDWNKFTLDLSNEVLIPQGLTAGRDLLGNLFENVRKQGALNLDGNSRVSVHENASIDLSDCSLEAWVCPLPESGSGWQTIFSKVSQANLQIYLDAADLLSHYNTATAGGVLYSTAFNKNEWHHIVCVEDGTDVLTYVDGVLRTTKTISLQMDSDGDFSIGSKPGVLADEITAQIAQPRIYNRALTAEEIQRNFDAGKYTYTND